MPVSVSWLLMLVLMCVFLLQFVGFHGQSYQVHGYPGSWFNIIDAPLVQMNAKFAYLASGTCNYNNTACWTHPGTGHTATTQRKHYITRKTACTDTTTRRMDVCDSRVCSGD